MTGIGEALIRRYLAGLTTHDLPAVLGCFVPDGTISSPVYGVQRAADFYPRLFADSLFTEIAGVRLFNAIGAPHEWIAVFDYRWQRSGSAPIETRLVDMFTLCADTGAIQSLEISNIGAKPG